MLHFVIGLPGHFARGCSEAVLSRIRRNGGWPEIVAVNTPEQMTRAILVSGNCDIVLLASHPGGRIRSALAEARRPFLVAIDDPRRGLADLVLDMHMDFAAAVRMVASACPSVVSCAQIEYAMLVRANDPAAHTAATLARYLDSMPDDLGIAAPANRPRPMAEVQQWWASLDPMDRSLAEGAVSAYLAPDGKSSKTLRWDGALFLNGHSSPSLTGSIDITGRKRILFEGPDILVANGAWRLILTMEFSRVAADYDYRLEAVAGDVVLAALDFRPPGGGEQQSVLDFCIADSIDYPLSIRLSLQRAAFDGTVILKNAVLHTLLA